MGNRMSRIVVGCFSSEQGHEKYSHGLHFSEPLDEGLGHSFCYVRPVQLPDGDSGPISSPPLELPVESSDIINSSSSSEVVVVEASHAVAVDELLPNLEPDAATKPRVVWERPKHNERTKKTLLPL